jgi:hypothetical protein
VTPWREDGVQEGGSGVEVGRWFADTYRGLCRPGSTPSWHIVSRRQGKGSVCRTTARRLAPATRRVVQRCKRCSAGLAQHTRPRAGGAEAPVQCRTEGRSRSGVAHARAAIRCIVDAKEEMGPATGFALKGGGAAIDPLVEDSQLRRPQNTLLHPSPAWPQFFHLDVRLPTSEITQPRSTSKLRHYPTSSKP